MSNFYPCKFRDNKSEQIWISSEHYYQAHKFAEDCVVVHDGTPILARQLIAKQPTAKACYKLSWQYQDFYRPDWFDPAAIANVWLPLPGMLVKDLIMWRALMSKFSDTELMNKLKATGKKQLIEHALKDSHFGCGIDGKGLNMLGKLLMYGRDNGF
jgi:GTP cyclohydrolase II